MDMKKKGWAGILRRKQYVIAGTLVVIAAIGTTVLYSRNQEKERQQMETQFAEEMRQTQEEVAEVPETEKPLEASAVIPPKTNSVAKTPEADETAENTETTESTETEGKEETTKKTGSTVDTLHFSKEQGMTWPMEGDVIMNYSMDSTIYFATLDQYKYNPAIIIAGEINDKVYSVARGKIKEIKNNEVTGCTVTVDLGDGYQAIYGQLKELNFKVGDYVEAGHVLGYIGEPTKYYSVEGSNLYFELVKDGVPVDPIEYFQ